MIPEFEPDHNHPLNTPEGMLRRLLVRNANGVWLIRVDDDDFARVPRWMWGHCEKALPDAEVIR